MVRSAEQLSANRPPIRLGRLPIPHEHGAWVMLYLPAIAAFVAAGGAPAWRWAALLGAVTGLFMAREAAGLIIRKRSKAGTGLWLGIYLSITALCAVPLLSGQSRSALLLISAIAVVLFGLHSLMLVIPARKRLDRSILGEILGAAGLTLTGPAAWAVARGRFDAAAWILWALSTLYFSGGIFYVKMWLEAVKHKKEWSAGLRAEIGRKTFLFHSLLVAFLVLLAVWLRGSAGAFLLLAFTPAIVRAYNGWAKLSPELPNLKRVGLLESAIAVWFGLFLTLSLMAWR